MQRVFTNIALHTVVLAISVDPTILNFLTVPQPLSSVPSGLKLASNTIYAFDPTFRNPRSGQFSAALEQELDHNTKVTVGFTHSATWALQRRIDTNLLQPAVLANGYVAYPTFDFKRDLIKACGHNAATGQGI